MPISIRLPKETEQRLDALASATGRTKTQRLADIKAGKSRTYTLDEVEERLGLAD